MGLVMNGRDSSRVVDGTQLRRIVAPHASSLRTVLLSACRTGDGGAFGNRVGSVSQAIHRSGIENVVASRFPLSVDGSTSLMKAFYRVWLKTRVTGCTVARPSGGPRPPPSSRNSGRVLRARGSRPPKESPKCHSRRWRRIRSAPAPKRS